MGREIIPTTTSVRNSVKRYRETLEKTIASGGNFIEFDDMVGRTDGAATLRFTEKAFTKMAYAVMVSNMEIAWHFTVHREVDTDNYTTYVLDDLFLYPQEASATTVNTDQGEYEKWLMNLPDDVFNNLRGQGHSHVNMAVYPSDTDTELYEGIEYRIEDFYIFMIVNKDMDMWVEIFDKDRNLMFGTDSGDVVIMIDGVDDMDDTGTPPR